MNSIIISNQEIRALTNGTYCLNDFHHASGENASYRPSNFVRLDTTKALLNEITKSSDMSLALKVIKGGTKQGTYACKELVYAYAMWISPAFHLKVIRTFDEVMQKQLEELRNAKENKLPYQPLTPGQQRHIQNIVREKVRNDELVTYQTVWHGIKDHFNVGTYKDIPAEKYGQVCAVLDAKPLEGEVIQHKKFNYPLDKSPLSNEVCQMKEWPLVCLDDLDKNKRPQLLPQLMDELKQDNYDVMGAFTEAQALYAYRDRLEKMVEATKQIHDILQDAVFDGRRGERVSLGHSI